MKPEIMECDLMTELHDAVMTYIQVTGTDITEETKKIADRRYDGRRCDQMQTVL